MLYRVFLSLLLLFTVSFSSEINWFSFQEGVKRAKREHKLIIMDIYAQWCHWCNVIENTTYRDKKVRKIIEEFFIPVRVDAEKEPDINKKYNQGGLPTTVILTPDKEILWGSGRYISPEDMFKLLNYFSSLSQEEIEDMAQRNRLRKKAFLKRFHKKIKEKDISYSLIEKTFKYVKLKFDNNYGGFVGAPKFPVDELPYFLMLYSLFDNDFSYRMVEKTLDGYENLIDPVEGGIYRYSTTEYWTEPHYEKLLKDQGELSILFFNGYSFTGKKKYLKDAISLIDFSLKKLYSREKNLFYNSQGADIIDENGTILMTGEEFFPRGKEERETIISVLGYGPNIEKDIYFPNNAIIARALLYAYSYTNKEKYKNTAIGVLNRILEEGLTEKGIKYSPDKDKFFLHSQIYTIEALLTAYQVTGDIAYLHKSKKLLDILLKYYYSKKNKIFTDYNDTGVSFEHISFIDDIINLNYRASKILYKMYLFTGDEKLKILADSIIKHLPDKSNLSTALSYFLYLKPPLVVHNIGKKDISVSKIFSIFPFWVFSHFIDIKEKKLIEALGYKQSEGIYICNTQICFKKISSKENIKKAAFDILKSYKNLK